MLTTVPFVGWVTPVIVSVSLASGAISSLASTSNVVAPLSSATVSSSSFAVGSSLRQVTVTVRLEVEVSSPSLTSTSHVVDPQKFGAGV